MNIKSYKMLHDSMVESEAVEGTIVYGTIKNDYGMANDDTRMTGREHISVTLKSDGDYPLFTVPLDHLEEMQHTGE